MMNLIKTSLVAGIAVFAWVNISWMVLPWHSQTIHSFKDDQSIQAALLENIDSQKPGIYSVPAMHDCKAVEGPSALVALTPKGQHFSPVKLVNELLLDIAITFLLTWLLLQTTLISYFDRLKFVLVVGLAIALASYIPYLNWWGFGLDYIAIGILDSLISALIAGLVIAKLAK